MIISNLIVAYIYTFFFLKASNIKMNINMIVSI